MLHALAQLFAVAAATGVLIFAGIFGGGRSLRNY